MTLESDRHPPLPFNDLLCLAMEQSQAQGEFSAVDLFTRWLREWGAVYFFLYRKNRRITDIQVAELMSLLRVNSEFRDNGSAALDLQFLSKKDFEQSVNALANTFTNKDNHERYGEIAKRYGELFRKVVVIQNYFGSAAVYVPPFLNVKLGPLCAESGYVHSCGEGVFLRNVYKATEEDFFKELSTHLDRTLTPGRKLFFTVYSHEDFTEWDRGQVRDLHDGLDDIKLHVSKMYMDRLRLVDVIKHMRSRFNDRLVFPDPGDYRESHRAALTDPQLDHTRSLWLIVDSDVGTVKGLRGDRRFFILYDQRFINESPFIECDENKPAWIDHTTIPHTLMGAMINITRPYWNGNHTTVVDPFMGSGTTYLESLKFGSQVTCIGGDNTPICPLVIEDNVRYLSGTYSAQKQIAHEVGGVADYFGSVRTPRQARGTEEQTVVDNYEKALVISLL
jgi:hypothetical protein